MFSRMIFRASAALLFFSATANAQLGVVGTDTSTAAPIDRYRISVKNDTVYYRGYTGGKKTLTSSGHLHVISDVNGLDSTLNTKQSKIYGYPGYDETNNHHVLQSNGGAISWEQLDISGISYLQDSLDSKVGADTLNGRAVFRLPSYVAAKIPDSMHFVIEPDFIKARSSGNSLFDTLRSDAFFYNILRDSVELYLTDFDTLFKSNVTFQITFFGADDPDSLFVHDATSIIYFSDTVLAYTGTTYYSNYLSHNHPSTYFRITPLTTFQLYWIQEEKKYYVTKKDAHEYNY